MSNASTPALSLERLTGCPMRDRIAVCSPSPMLAANFHLSSSGRLSGLCPVAWCKSASPRLSPVAQAVTADSLRTGSSLNALRLSSDM
jgi:hypothetical protein